MTRWFGAAVLAAAGLVAAGCGEAGPKRNRVTGEAKFDGQPIPYGDVLFTPDGSKNNSGPQGIAQIRDGKFDTAGEDGKGVAGGPTVVRVTGFTGPGGQLLCEYEYQAVLPQGDGTFDVSVPKEGGAKNKKPAPDI
jgi:hypothetical protein